MKSIKQFILEYSEKEKFLNSEAIYLELLKVGFNFQSKTPKGTISATFGRLCKEGKLHKLRANKYTNINNWGDSRIIRTFSALDPYGEEDWEH